MLNNKPAGFTHLCIKEFDSITKLIPKFLTQKCVCRKYVSGKCVGRCCGCRKFVSIKCVGGFCGCRKGVGVKCVGKYCGSRLGNVSVGIVAAGIVAVSNF